MLRRFRKLLQTYFPRTEGCSVPIESEEVKEFTKPVEAVSRIGSSQTESNQDLQQRAKKAAKDWQQVEKSLFTRRITERNYENEEFLKKKRTSNMALSQIPDVDIDTCGVFKYILIELKDKDGKKRNIVRGQKRFDYHDDILQDLQSSVGSVKCRCLGGGRIEHRPMEKVIKVYGYSQAYGQANHEEAVEILKTKYKDYKMVWTNEGY